MAKWSKPTHLREDSVMAFLVNKANFKDSKINPKGGLPLSAACGILANLYAETTTYNPTPPGNSFGICQWTNSGDRKNYVINWARQHGYDPNTLGGQLRMMEHEVVTGKNVSNGTKLFTMMATSGPGATQAYNVARQFSLWFERPGGGEKSADARGESARAMYEYYSKKPLYSESPSSSLPSTLMKPTVDHGALILAEARRLLTLAPGGKPGYSRDAGKRHGPNTYDCSGFAYTVLKNVLGLSWINKNSFPGTSTYQCKWCVEKGRTIPVNAANVKPGDLFFYDTNPDRWKNIGHVAIAVGGDLHRVVHALNKSKGTHEGTYSRTPVYIGRVYNPDDPASAAAGIVSDPILYHYGNNYGSMIGGGIELTNIDTYREEMLSQLEEIKEGGYKKGYLVDLTNGGSFEFMVPEFSSSTDSVYEDITILGRSVNVKGYANNTGKSASISLTLAAGVDPYEKKSDVDDPIDRMYKDIAFVESLQYPDYSKSIILPPPVVLLSLGKEFSLKGVITSVSVDYKKPVDTLNRYMVAELKFTIVQMSDNPPDLHDVRRRSSVAY